jgi:hypothetical protein
MENSNVSLFLSNILYPSHDSFPLSKIELGASITEGSLIGSTNVGNWVLRTPFLLEAFSATTSSPWKSSFLRGSYHHIYANENGKILVKKKEPGESQDLGLVPSVQQRF